MLQLGEGAMAMSEFKLRPIRRDDFPHFMEWVNDPEVTHTLILLRPIAEGLELEFLERALANDNTRDVFFAFDGPDGTYAGNIGLHAIDWISRKAELGIVVGRKDLWGKGIGALAIKAALAYAFNDINLEKVYLRVFDHNERGIKLYKSLGFVQEGIMRRDAFKNGVYHDTIFMSILREEWQKLYPSS
jgi:RimJ/RimL family protein N-acetyltransferase